MNGAVVNGQNNGQLVSSSDSKSWLMDRIIGCLIRFLQYERIRFLIAVVWIGFTSFCLVKIFQMKEGLEMNRTARYDSEIAMYFKVEDKYFGVMNRRIHLVITDDNLDFGNATDQDNILKLLDKINGLPLVNGDEALREDWLSLYLKRCKKRGKSSFKTNLLTCLRRYASKLPLRLNVKLSDDRSRIIATRFMFQSENITSAIMDMNLTKSLRQVADESSFNITVFSPIFPLVDQYLQVWSNTILSLGISLGVVLLVTFLLIPNIKACILLSFTISSTIIQVGGFMVLLDINLDVVSMIELIMCIGFSVDFCAHVCNHFYSSGGPQDTQDVNEEIKESLRAYGPPIVQGAISTILAVLPMFFLPSYILKSFTKMVMMVIGLGALHGLIVLPAIMGIVVRIQWEIK